MTFIKGNIFQITDMIQLGYASMLAQQKYKEVIFLDVICYLS
jgi:hypothetical protein